MITCMALIATPLVTMVKYLMKGGDGRKGEETGGDGRRGKGEGKQGVCKLYNTELKLRVIDQ